MSIVVVELDVLFQPIPRWSRPGIGIERIQVPRLTEPMKVVVQIGVVKFDVVVLRVVYELPSANRVT